MHPDWSQVSIAGKPAAVFAPPGAAPRFAVLALHSFDLPPPADDPAFTDALTRHGLACCAPEGEACWWLDRVDPEFDPDLPPERHVVENVLPWMRERWSLGPVAAVGSGLGGQAAVRLGFRHPDRFPVVAGLGSAFDFHEWHGRGTPLDAVYATRERARQDTAVLHLDPHRYPPHVWFACDPADGWYRGNDRLHEKLSAYGIPHTVELDGPGTVDAMLAFVAAALAKQSRRLV